MAGWRAQPHPRRRTPVRAAWLCLWVLVTTPAPASTTAAVDGPLSRQQVIARAQAVEGTRLDAIRLRDRRGRPVVMSDFRGKPLVISPVYTSCAQVCRTTTRNLERAVRRARQVLGEKSFRVITVGFDPPRDDPSAMAAFARRQGVDEHDWGFLSGSPESVGALMTAIGFSYWPSAKGYDHVTQTTIVDGRGVIRSQVFGELSHVPLLVEPLKRIVFGVDPKRDDLVDTVVKRIRFFCTDYDPATGSYRFDYSLFMGMAIGAASILGVAGYLLAALIGARRRRRATGA